ncbi:CRISPR-associated helicase Cas3 [Actinobacteria bacterium OK074]|nr:CRISPR-associated helicase Cas3 [Actinobacteria bacterium OK074]
MSDMRGANRGDLPEVLRELGLPAAVIEQLGALWGKSAEKGGGTRNLLLGHLLDTAAVAEVMWGSYLAPWMRWRLDEISGGHGRQFFMWICGIHDCGKATPPFQAMDPAGGALVRAAGLTWPTARLKGRSWRHDRAGGALLSQVLRNEWKSEHVRWVSPLVAGHHGVFPTPANPPSDDHQGRGPDWKKAQRALLDVFTRVVGYDDLKAVQPVQRLTKAEQLALSGLIVMADWIASNHEHFPGLDELGKISLSASRGRAADGWRELGLRGGWGEIAPPSPSVDLIRLRFGDHARSSQAQLVRLAQEMSAPGLLVVEAPMGEGKTKGALAAAEVLASRFGMDGVFLAMPTQATCDPMYEHVLEWVPAFGDGLPEQVALLHGKHRFNKKWKALWEASSDDADDPYGSVEEDEELGMGSGCATAERHGPAQWFRGPKRGQLAGFVVGTIDHLLYAATRTRHVMLRFAGLAGKVVVIDEVHAADVYMRQFLTEALRWLGQARVPVVLLSATLPPFQRQILVDSYLSGALGRADVHEDVPEPAGYPCVTAAWVQDGKPVVHTPNEVVDSWRASQDVTLSWLPDVSNDGAAVAEAVREALLDGGVALVILNSVDRAQGVFGHLKDTFDGEVHLLHGRLCAAHRAERTDACLKKLGPKAGELRPHRMVVVATQLAEQSFDADADILFTDLAPVDLLLQRIGRLHRHSGTKRPESLREPRVLITGIAPGLDEPEKPDSAPPRFLRTSELIYGTYGLLRAAALVTAVAGRLGEAKPTETVGSWSVPADVPNLVAEAYGDADICPDEWRTAEEAARAEWHSKEDDRAEAAQEYLLTARRNWASPTLAGLHYGEARIGEEGDLDAVVRDGDDQVEVVIVRQLPSGYAALDGTRIGVHGEALDADVVESVLGGITRLPLDLTSAAKSDLAALPGWSGDPWLKHALALVLDESGNTQLGDFRVRYDDELGLCVSGGRRR